MKNIILAWLPLGFLLLTGLAALPACDVINNPQPLKITVSAGRRDTLALDSAEARLLPAAPVQRVLLEDFTGQYCGNCPRAAHMADSLRQAYPGRVLVTEVHVTDYFAAPRPPHFPIDFRVPTVSQEIDQTFDLANRGLPQGAVNRSPVAAANNDLVATYTLWPAVVASQLARPPQVDLRLTPLYNKTTRLLRLKVSTTYAAALPGRDLRLGILLVEDSLPGAQKDYRLPRATQPDQTDEYYVHHNVMRAALTGTFGSAQVSSPTAGKNLVTYLGYQLPAPTVWNDRRCSLVAYIADASTRQILQAATVKLF